MKFHEFGNKSNPHIMLIHGGGNAWWNYLRQARALSENYHVILPNLDGHGEEYHTAYISTENSADKIIQYIQENCGGSLFALGGVSLGGQIVIDILSKCPAITKKAVIDGSICYPQPVMANICIGCIRIFGWLLFSKAACRYQISMMNKYFPAKMRYTEEMAELYMKDMPRTGRNTLYTIYRTYMMRYRLKESIRDTTTEVVYWYGSKEMKCVKKSAQLFKEMVPSCKIYEAEGYDHGYLSIYLPDEWLQIAGEFFKED